MPGIYRFDNKAHLFLSVLEHRLQEIAELCKEVLKKETADDPKRRLQAFEKFYTMLYRPDWAILHLEFKLYGLRHPESFETLKQISGKIWGDSLYEGLDRFTSCVKESAHSINR